MRRYTDCPIILRDFLTYHETIKGQSQKTISEYYLDLRMFLRFIKLMRQNRSITTRLDEIDIRDVDLDFVSRIDTSEIFDFLSYLANDRNPDPDSLVPDYGISPASRARKLSAIKSFYKYLTVRTKQLENNPVAELEYPKLRKSLPSTHFFFLPSVSPLSNYYDTILCHQRLFFLSSHKLHPCEPFQVHRYLFPLRCEYLRSYQ